MNTIILWVPWDAESKSHEAAAYAWVSRLQRLLNPNFEYKLPLHIEGTSALVDEFIPSSPQAQSWVKQSAAAGELWVGPWYARPCETLSSGETLVRNLLLGTNQALELGLPTHTCFLFPAPIHINQMPQILAGFGIRLAAIPLGDNSWSTSKHDSHPYTWRAANSSAVTLLPLPIFSMGNVGNSDTTSTILVNAASSATETAAMNWGVLSDSAIVLEDIKVPLDHQSVVDINGELLTADQEDADELLSITRLANELTAFTSAYTSVWPGLRQSGWSAQTILERWAEPWAAAAWLCGKEYPAHFLAKAWRHILLNQRTDASAGCNNDPTYRHMLVRADRATHLADAICRDGLAAVVRGLGAQKNVTTNDTSAKSQRSQTATQTDATFTGTPLWVANPLGWARNEVICVDVPLPTATQYLALKTSDGQPVPYQLHHAEPAAVQAIRGGQPGRRFTVSFKTSDIPATGFIRLLADTSQHRPYFMGESIAAGNTLENKLIRVTVKPSGALRIEDKRTGHVYDNCNVFEDGGDAGSFVAFKPPEQDKLITTYATHAHVSIVENGTITGAIQVQHELTLPAELHPYRDRRSDQRVNCNIISLITLRQGSDRVEIRTQIMNQAQDHRLRVLFSSGIPASTCHVAQPFDVVERATGMAECGGFTPETGTMPKLEFVDISNDHYGLMVASRGIYEYEVKPTPAGTIALTLLRAVGQTANGAPAASQALESLEFEYAIIPHAGKWTNATQSAWEFCSPLRTFTAQDLGICSLAECVGPSRYSLVTVEPELLLLTTIKRSEDSQALIVRAFNPTDQPIQGAIRTEQPVVGSWLAGLNEEALAPLAHTDPQHISVECAPHQIITVRLAFAG